MTASERLLKGRVITGFDLRSIDSGLGFKAHSPLITLDNGAKVTFIVEELEGGYSIRPIYHRPAKRGKA